MRGCRYGTGSVQPVRSWQETRNPGLPLPALSMAGPRVPYERSFSGKDGDTDAQCPAGEHLEGDKKAEGPSGASFSIWNVRTVIIFCFLNDVFLAPPCSSSSCHVKDFRLLIIFSADVAEHFVSCLPCSTFALDFIAVRTTLLCFSRQWLMHE